MANIWPIFLHTAWSFKGLLCQNFVYKHRGRFIGQLGIAEIQKRGGGGLIKIKNIILVRIYIDISGVMFKTCVIN